MMALLELKNLTVKIDNKKIINDLNLNIEKGEVYCLIGRNGTGKTTLANTLIGINKAKGSIIFKSKRINNLSITERAKNGLTLAWQKPVEIEGLTVAEYLKLGNKEMSEEKIGELLSSVGLECSEYSDRLLDDTLSGGERKRIELASIIGMRTDLVVLDEPDSGIDVLSLHLISNIIKKLKEQGTSVLLITHRDDIVKISDKAGIMCAGKIIREGKPKNIQDYFSKSCDVCGTVNEPRDDAV
ncbi:ABC transporter ATP-binding protein [archaeon CG07_land_8_20_14_0_80_38_8]|nr:MAG: ABC transporter ATP-binding protein [archaeon CG07_land_8_20_14_0_80_38_8]PIU88253.1 MAG: ABC transporter ATP-binding protein [archaeon CG06_land_8_20_14_3_00_37_11]